MIRALYIPRIVSLVTLLFLTVSSLAEEATNTFSGRIVDVKGHPVTGLTLITRPTKLINGHAITATDDVTIPFSAFDKSDEAGYFFITYVKPGPVQLELRSPMPGESEESWKSYEILSMKTGPTTFYPTDPSHWGGLKFAIAPEATLEDVVVTVRPRTRYRGQVVFMDGTPLGNTMVDLDVQSKHKKGHNSFKRQMVNPEQTDANGYFVRYVDGVDFEIASYTVSVKFQGLTATAEFRLKSGEQREDLVFALEGAPMPIRGQIVFDDETPLPETLFTLDVKATGDDEEHRSHLSGQRETDNAGFFVEYLYQPGCYAVAVEYQGLSATSELTLKVGEQRDDLVFTLNGAPIFFDIFGVEMMAPTVPNTIGVWIGAPNGSQYKSVRCSSWQDARTKARAEGVQLVSINDGMEQGWLAEQFEFLPYWIGLAYSIETGE